MDNVFELYSLDESDERFEQLGGKNICFVRNRFGCWYEQIKNFKPHTWKICYLTDGTVVAGNKDASSLFPLNMCVVELQPSKVPEEFSPNGLWIFDGKNLRKKG